jgi:DNA-binding SARP family transcriptional activator
MLVEHPSTEAGACDTGQPILICMLGNFQVLQGGQAVAIPSGGKTEALLAHLALRGHRYVPRAVLLDTLWPELDPARAGQSLSSLVYSLHKLLGNALEGASPIMQGDGYCWLHTEISVDIACFVSLADSGERFERAGDQPAAVQAYLEAVELYRGDLRSGSDVTSVVEREHLRARYLTLLARLADYFFAQGDYDRCRRYTSALLASDPFREDAHRMAMRCYMRCGERAQALRQFRLCEQVLRAEFDAAPEPATCQLYEQVRLDPAAI